MPTPRGARLPDTSPRLPLVRWSTPIAGGIILVAGLAVYANSLGGPFVFDDLGAIVDNPTIRTLWRLTDVFSPPAADGQTVGGRPLLNFTFAINYAISGIAVWSYHVANLAIHIAAALLLFGLVRRTLELGAKVEAGQPAEATSGQAGAVTMAAAVALFWVVHPLNTAAVTYVVQRAESLAGMLFLLTLYAFARSVDADGQVVVPVKARGIRRPRPAVPAGAGETGASAWRWRALSIGACLAGMATKETLAGAPLLVLLYDRAFVARSLGAAWRNRWRYYAPLGATWILPAGLIAATGNRGGSAGLGAVTSNWDYLLTQAGAILRYLRLAVWPDDLVFDYGMRVVSGPAEVWPQALVVGVVLAATLWALVRNLPLGFVGGAFFLLLAPSSSIVPVTSQTMAEHRMYLPLAVVILLGVAAAFRLLGMARMLALVVVLGVGLGATTVARNSDYRSAVGLWHDTVQKVPANTRAHVNLGTALAQEGRPAEAMRSFREALRLYPNHASAHYNLGVALAAEGKHAEALEHLSAAVRLEPESASARINLGNALVRTGQPDQAVEHFEIAVRLEPESADGELNLGLALLAAGRQAEATAPLRRALARMPQNVEARFTLANALARGGDFAAAIDVYREILAIAPNHIMARNNLANALLVAGRTTEAIAEYEKVLRARPGDAAVRANLEEARAIERAAGGPPP